MGYKIESWEFPDEISYLRAVIAGRNIRHADIAKLCSISGPSLSEYLNERRSMPKKILFRIKEILQEQNIESLLKK